MTSGDPRELARNAAGAAAIDASTAADDDALALQERLLAGVSETFARTIPQLPQPLRAAMTNFYMLLKVADVIEDSPVLEPERKRRLLGQYVEVVEGHARPEAFTHALLPAISEGATVAELDLVANTGTLLGITNSLEESPATPSSDARASRLSRRYLAAALDFTLMIPRYETGVRRFLLWSLGAMLVVARRIAANPGFRSVEEVQVHRDIRAVVAASSLAVRSDRALRWMFDVAARPLRSPPES